MSPTPPGQALVPDGHEIAEATSAVMIQLGEEIVVGNGRRFRVLDVVPFEEDSRPLIGAAPGWPRHPDPEDEVGVQEDLGHPLPAQPN